MGTRRPKGRCASNPKYTEFRWGVGQGAAWHWDRINHWLDGGTFDREWKFNKAGETLLRIAVREDATMLDAIFVTTNVKATAADQANVRLPTDKDRKIQIEGLAVDAKGKAATTWGSLKRVVSIRNGFLNVWLSHFAPLRLAMEGGVKVHLSEKSDCRLAQGTVLRNRSLRNR